MEISGLLEPVAAPRAVSSLSRAFRRRCQWPFNLDSELPVPAAARAGMPVGPRASFRVKLRWGPPSQWGALALALWHGQPAFKLPRVRVATRPAGRATARLCLVRCPTISKGPSIKARAAFPLPTLRLAAQAASGSGRGIWPFTFPGPAGPGPAGGGDRGLWQAPIQLASVASPAKTRSPS